MYINGAFAIVEDSVIADCEATFAGGTSNNGKRRVIYMDGGSSTQVAATEMCATPARSGVIHDVSGGAIRTPPTATTISIEDSRPSATSRGIDTKLTRLHPAPAPSTSGNSLTIRNSEIISNGVGAIFSEGRALAAPFCRASSSSKRAR